MRVLLGVVGLILNGACSAAENPFDALITQAREEARLAKVDEAIGTTSKAIALEPKNPQGYYYRGHFQTLKGDSKQAIADFDKTLELEPKAAQVYQKRGTEHFKLGHVAESLADFDRFIDLTPAQGAHHWQRGISLYYAERYGEGKRQFELHQTVNPDDVENAVWHFLCTAKKDGIERAREILIPIRNDSRVPMMKIHDLFAGKAEAADVLAAANAGDPPNDALKQRLFYAHLYLGLYYEALGQPEKSFEHIRKAAGDYYDDHYMGYVARVHLQRRSPK